MRRQQYVLSAAAVDDLAEIIAFIRKDDREAAKRVRIELQCAMERLAAMPNIGHHREDLARGTIRFWPVFSYLIIYLPETNPLQVLRVLHGARDLNSILGCPETWLNILSAPV